MSQNTPATHVLNQSLTTACIDLDSSRTARHGTVWRSSRDRKPSFMATAFVELVYDHKNKAWNAVKEMIPIDTYCPCCIDTSASSTWHPAADSQCDPCQQSKWYATIATLIYPKTIFPRRDQWPGLTKSLGSGPFKLDIHTSNLDLGHSSLGLRKVCLCISSKLCLLHALDLDLTRQNHWLSLLFAIMRRGK